MAKKYGKKIYLDELADAVISILDDYEEDLNKQFQQDIKATAKVVKDEVRKIPPGAGRYSDWKLYSTGWRYETTNEYFGEYTYVVYNAHEAGLTHLLEEGHINQDGTYARAFPHIEPAYEKGVEELYRRLNAHGSK